MDNEVVGAIKIKDGLFMGDEFSAQDLEFVIANKVTHVINTASKTVTNHWEAIGIIYLCYDWEDNESQVFTQYRSYWTSRTKCPMKHFNLLKTRTPREKAHSSTPSKDKADPLQ